MKKIAATVVVIIGALFLFPTDTAQAAEKVSGNFHYKVLNKKKKTAAVTYVENVGSKLVIPKKIKGYKVVQIGSDCRTSYRGEVHSVPSFYNKFGYSGHKCDCNIKLEEGHEHNCKNRILSKEGAKKLKKVVFPDTVTTIGINAFVDCPKLKQVTLPKKLKYIWAMAFKNTALSTLVLPKTMKGVGYYAFDYCVKLKKLVVKSDAVKIGEFAFAIYPRKLKTIQLPSQFKGSLMTGCFDGFVGTSFTWPEFKREQENVDFFDAPYLKTVKIAKGAKKIFFGKEIFTHSRVKKLVIPASVKKVTLEQQRDTLESITIKGKKTVLIGEGAMGTYPYRVKRKYISARTIIAPKNSKAWKFAKKAYYPDTFNFVPAIPEEWAELINDPEHFYEESDITMKKVKRKVLK